DKLLLARSVEAWDAVHGRAQYYVQAAHPLNLAISKEIPPMGTVVGLEYAARRRESDTLPPYVAMNVTQSQAGLLNSRFLPATYSPLHINTATNLSAFSPDAQDKKDFERRWALLKQFDHRLRSDASLEGKAYRDYNQHYEGAVQLMSDPRTKDIFRLDAPDRKRYGETTVGNACIRQRNLVAADAGHGCIIIRPDGCAHHRV